MGAVQLFQGLARADSGLARCCPLGLSSVSSPVLATCRQGPGRKSSVRGAGSWIQGSWWLALALVLTPHPAWVLSAVLAVG